MERIPYQYGTFVNGPGSLLTGYLRIRLAHIIKYKRVQLARELRLGDVSTALDGRLPDKL